MFNRLITRSKQKKLVVPLKISLILPVIYLHFLKIKRERPLKIFSIMQMTSLFESLKLEPSYK